MSKAQDCVPASPVEPAPLAQALGLDSPRLKLAHVEAPSAACGTAGTGAGLGGHALLSRPAPPQGRRSLFRR